MKVLVLAGGYGTRLSEETRLIPKPMVEIDGRPLLWHIMKVFSHHGFNEFIILLGYKAHLIKDYFLHYSLHQNSVTIDLSIDQLEFHAKKTEPWKVTLLETGLDSMTGGRILRAKPFIGEERFIVAYGDTLMDIDLPALLEFHRGHGKTVTMTTAQPQTKYGIVEISADGAVERFQEKPRSEGNWVNGGFLVCEPRTFDYLNQGDSTVLEGGPLEHLAKDGELYAYRHRGFYRCMDTLKDKNELNELCEKKLAKWKVWETE